MTIDDTKIRGAESCLKCNAPSIGLTADALPEVQSQVFAGNSQTGVSTNNGLPDSLRSSRNGQHWFVLRTTYGREKKAYEYILANNGTAYYPTIVVDKLVDGRRKSVEVSRIPNIFFAYGTEEEIKRFVYDNVHLPYLRFYYHYYNKDNHPAKEPIIVPDRQMRSLRIVCEAENQDTIVTSAQIAKFKKGQLVRINAGPFNGVVGRVARFKGQQRVGLVVDGVVTAVTAYIPKGMMENI